MSTKKTKKQFRVDKLEDRVAPCGLPALNLGGLLGGCSGSSGGGNSGSIGMPAVSASANLGANANLPGAAVQAGAGAALQGGNLNAGLGAGANINASGLLSSGTCGSK